MTLKEIKAKETLKMTELAELNGVRYSTVKYYCELGLLPFQQAGEGLIKRYPRQEASARLKEILRLRDQGKSVPEVISLFLSR